MSVATLIIGESGSGKTTSLRNLDPEKTLVIQPIGKPLPFPSKGWKLYDAETKSGSIYKTDSTGSICQILDRVQNVGKTVVIIDDAQYLMANEFMRRSKEKGFDKFNDIGKGIYDVIVAATNAPGDLRVYFLWHPETDAEGTVKAKTIGKMVDDKVNVAGLFTICLRCQVVDGEHVFSTRTTGADTVKAPMGMFERDLVPNDLAEVDAKIRNFYGIEDATTQKKGNP